MRLQGEFSYFLRTVLGQIKFRFGTNASPKCSHFNKCENFIFILSQKNLKAAEILVLNIRIKQLNLIFFDLSKSIYLDHISLLVQHFAIHFVFIIDVLRYTNT